MAWSYTNCVRILSTLSGRAGPLSGRSRAALHAKAMAFDGEAVFIGSFNLDPRSRRDQTPKRASTSRKRGLRKADGLHGNRRGATIATALRLDPKGEVVWEHGEGRPNGALRDGARDQLSKETGREPVEAAADRLATLSTEFFKDSGRTKTQRDRDAPFGGSLLDRHVESVVAVGYTY